MKTRLFDCIGKYVTVLNDRVFPLYLVRGDRNFLIDSGTTVYFQKIRRRIDAVLAESPQENRRGIDTLLLTHTHWDHAGSAFELQKIYRFDVMTSEYGCRLLEKEKVVAFVDRLNQEYKKMQGDASGTCFAKLEGLKPLREGDRVEVGQGAYFEVFLVPGHTQCSVAYLLQPERILFPGDSVGVTEQDGSIKPLFLSDYNQYEASLRKIAAMAPAALCFAHNRFVVGSARVAEYLKRSLERAGWLKNLILAELRSDKPDAEIVEGIFLREFSKPTLLGPREAMMINLQAMVAAVRRETSAIQISSSPPVIKI